MSDAAHVPSTRSRTSAMEYSGLVTTDSLRIVITDPHLKGGGQVRYVTNLTDQLLAHGHAVAIGCKGGSVLAEIGRRAGCEVFDAFTFRGGLRPRMWKQDLAEAHRVLRAFKPHILHVNGSQDHWVAALANRAAGFPAALIRTRHNTYPVSDSLPNRVLNRRWTDHQIVVCHRVREDLARQRAFDADRMCTIHNGVDAARFTPDPALRTDARAEFGYRDTDVVCGIVARLVPAKGHTYLFQAAARLKARYPQLRLLVLGEGKDADRLRAECHTLGIADITRFAGFRDDVPRCVNGMDIGVQPSVDCDTSSFSLKEFMAAEKPVVASDYGGLTEIVDDGVEGHVIPTGTVEPLADALARLLDSHGLRRRMGQRGRDRVLRDFTVEVFGRKTEEVYREVWQRHRAGRATG